MDLKLLIGVSLMLINYSQCLVNVELVVRPNYQKCLIREANLGGIVVFGQYNISRKHHGEIITMRIRDSYGRLLVEKEDVPHGRKLHFAFVTERQSKIYYCFSLHTPDYMTGIAQKIHLIITEDTEETRHFSKFRENFEEGFLNYTKNLNKSENYEVLSVNLRYRKQNFDPRLQ